MTSFEDTESIFLLRFFEKLEENISFNMNSNKKISIQKQAYKISR